MKQIYFQQRRSFKEMYNHKLTEYKSVYLVLPLFSQKQVAGNYVRLSTIEQYGGRMRKKGVDYNFIRYIRRDNLTVHWNVSLNKFFLKEE